MRVGAFNRYVRIEKKTVTNNSDYGSPVIAWVSHAEAWASILDVINKQQESTNNDLRLLKRPCIVQMHYNDTITSDMRVVMLDRNNRMLQIVSSPAEVGDRELIQFFAEEYSE